MSAMGYYMGDYYGYRGDPGFLSVLGKIGSTVAGFIPGVGPSLSAGISALTKAKEVAPLALPAAAGAASSISKARAIGRAAGATVLKHPVLTGAGAAGIVGAAGVIAGRATKGSAAVSSGVSGAFGRRHRRMRVTNVKALRRAIRRAHGFAKIAKKCLSFTERRPHAGRAYFKKKSRRRVC